MMIASITIVASVRVCLTLHKQSRVVIGEFLPQKMPF